MGDMFNPVPVSFQLDVTSIARQYQEIVNRTNELQGKVEKAFASASKGAASSFDLSEVKNEMTDLVSSIEKQVNSLRNVFQNISVANFGEVQRSLEKLNTTVSTISTTLTTYTGSLDKLSANGADKKIDTMANNIETIMNSMKVSIEKSTADATKNLTDMLGVLAKDDDKKKAVSTFKNLADGLKALNMIQWELPQDKISAFQKSLEDLSSVNVPDNFSAVAKAVSEFKNFQSVGSAVKEIGSLSEETRSGKDKIDQFSESLNKLQKIFNKKFLKRFEDLSVALESLNDLDFSKFANGIRSLSELGAEDAEKAREAIDAFTKDFSAKNVSSDLDKVITLIGKVGTAFGQVKQAENWETTVRDAFRNIADAAELEVSRIEESNQKTDELSVRSSRAMSEEQLMSLARASGSFAMSLSQNLSEGMEQVSDLLSVFSAALVGVDNNQEKAKKTTLSLTEGLTQLDVILNKMNNTISQTMTSLTLTIAYFNQFTTGIDMTGFVQTFAELSTEVKKVNKETKEVKIVRDTKSYDSILEKWNRISSVAVEVSDETSKMNQTLSDSSHVFADANGKMKLFFNDHEFSENANQIMSAFEGIVQKVNDASEALNSLSLSKKGTQKLESASSSIRSISENAPGFETAMKSIRKEFDNVLSKASAMTLSLTALSNKLSVFGNEKTGDSTSSIDMMSNAVHSMLLDFQDLARLSNGSDIAFEKETKDNGFTGLSHEAEELRNTVQSLRAAKGDFSAIASEYATLGNSLSEVVKAFAFFKQMPSIMSNARSALEDFTSQGIGQFVSGLDGGNVGNATSGFISNINRVIQRCYDGVDELTEYYQNFLETLSGNSVSNLFNSIIAGIDVSVSNSNYEMMKNNGWELPDGHEDEFFHAEDKIAEIIDSFIGLSNSVANGSVFGNFETEIGKVTEALRSFNNVDIQNNANLFSQLNKSLTGLPEKMKAFASALQLPEGDTTVSILQQLTDIITKLGSGGAVNLQPLIDKFDALSSSFAGMQELMERGTKSAGLNNFEQLLSGIDVPTVTSFVNALGSLVQTETTQETTGNKFSASIQDIKDHMASLKGTANDLFHSNNKTSDEWVAEFTKWKDAVKAVETEIQNLKASMSQEGLDTTLLDKTLDRLNQSVAAMSGDTSRTPNGILAITTAYLTRLSNLNPDVIERTTMSIKVLGDVNVTNLNEVAEALNKLAQTDLTVHLNAEQIEAFKTALLSLADDSALKSLQKTVQNLRPLMKDLFKGVADNDNVAKITESLNRMEEALRGIFNVTPDSNQLVMLGDELAVISSQLNSGLFKLDENNNPIKPFLSSLENFDPTKINDILDKLGNQATRQGIAGLSSKLGTMAESIKAIGVSLGTVKDTSLMDVMQSLSQNVATFSSGSTEKFDQLIQSLEKLKTVKLNTTQFDKLRTAINETTASITNFVKSLAKMTPSQLDNLLENVITLSNATGNATAQAAAQMRQSYDDMRGKIEDMQHALKGMFKADPSTFATYESEFYQAADAVQSFIDSLDNSDGGYHNLKTEASIIREMGQCWTDASAATEAYNKKVRDTANAEASAKSQGIASAAAATAQGKIEQIKAIATEMSKLETTSSGSYLQLDKQLQSLIADINTWYNSAKKTEKVEKIYGNYKSVLIAVNAQIDKLIEQEIKREDKAPVSNEFINKLREEGRAYASIDDAVKEYLGDISEYKIKDIVKDQDTENPLQRLVTYYREGEGQLTAIFKSIKDENGDLWYYLDETSTRTANYNANATVGDIVKVYQQLFDVRSKLAKLKDGDNEQRTKLTAERDALAETLKAYRETTPEAVALAKATEDYAKAKKKAEAAEAAKRDKDNTKDKAEQQKNYNNLLKRQYDIRKELQNLERGLETATNDTTRAAIQTRINTLKSDEENVSKDIADYEKSGIKNSELKLKYEKQLNDEKEKGNIKSRQEKDIQDQITNRILSTLRSYIVMRGLRKIWSEAITYATEYFDKLNEIQIVTMQTDSQIDALSQSYRSLARELQISSTDIATAAVEFWRQGLDEEETMSRTKWASMYAKITAQSFDEAATQITASTNSMGVSAQEVVDLFTYLGDASASSGSEIGTAMQKAAAAAAAFGLDFKHLGSYIATVSETTRQDAASIGTAFNTIIARWHSIKKTGYTTNDDGTTTGANDISKALGDVLGIDLFENGQWKDMAGVLDEIAAKWGSLDAAQKSYIATTMAGTKQQNVFLALMGDMSKGAENGSRMYELLAGAMESAGTVSEKYKIWMDSVAAAQGNLNVSLERLYTTVLNDDTLKKFYNTMASLADNFASGMETGFAQGAKNVLVFSAAVASTILVVVKLVSVIKELRAAKGISNIAGILTGGKLALVVGTVAAITAGVVALVGAYRNAHDEAQKLQDLQSKQDDIATNYSSLSKLQNEYTKLISVTNRTQEEEAQLKEVWKKLQTFSPTLAIALSNVSGGMENQEGVSKALREELDRLAKSYNGVVTAANKLSIKQIMDAYRTDQKKYNSYDLINDPALSANIGRLYDSKSGQSAISTIGELIPNMNDEHWWGKMSVTQIVNEITQAQYGVVENVRQALFSDKGFIEGTNLATEFVSQFVTAYKEALDASENDLNLSQFIIDAIQSSQNDKAADEAARSYAQQLYETMFDSMKPMNWDDMDFGSQAVFESFFKDMFTNGTIGEFANTLPAELESAIQDYQALNQEAKELGVQLTETVYGNVDTNDRQVLEWTEENLQKFKEAYESWGYELEDLEGSISTVMGTSAEYDGIEIAFTPILQTEDGAKLLDAETVDNYIWGLFNKAKKDGNWSTDELLELDKEGLEIDGQVIQGLLAGIGNTAIETAEAMHYVGKDGALAQARNEVAALAAKYGLSVKEALVGSAYDAGLTYIDQLAAAMEQGDETVSGVMLKLLQGVSDYAEKIAQTEWGTGWTVALNHVNSLYGTDEFDAAYENLEVAYNAYKEKYGDDFFVSLPSKEDFGGVAEALTEIGDAADEANTEVEKLSSKLEKVLANQTSANELKTLQNSNFKSWVEQLQSFINEDGTVDGSAMFAWLHNIDSSNLEKFLEVFPQFTAYLKQIAELGDNGGLGEAGEELEGFSDAVASASDQILVALNAYRDSHSGVTDEDGQSLLGELSKLMSIGEDGTLDELDSYIERFASASAEQQKWLLDNSNAILKFSTAWEKYKKALDTDDTEAAAAAMKDMKDAFSDLNREVANAHFDEVTKQIEKLTDATDTSSAVLGAYDKVYTMADNYAEAAEEYENLAKKYSNADQILYSDVSKIASVLNMSPQAVIQAWEQIPGLLQQYAQDGLSALDLLNQEAFFTITGTSSVDFSDLENGIVIVDNMAQDMLDSLIKTGQFEVETIPVSGIADVWDKVTNDFVRRQVNGTYQVLKPTGSNPFSTGGHRKSSSKSGSGGGGGSNNKSNSSKGSSRTEEERWVEEIDNRVKRITDRMSQLNTVMNSWDSEGYYTAEIKALGQVNGMLEDQDKILREKIAEAQDRLPALINQFNSTAPDTEAYDEILDRVNTIQDAITDWTQKLTENEASIVSNKKKIDDLNDSIRQLKLDLENEILEAIEDREQRIDDMLQARISMEETILEILKAQAEDAEQAILDAIDAQIDALNKEKDAVSELLDSRKEQADQEDKLAQLQQLQAKYSRIVADPTRAKDAQDILDQINDLRDEIAWDQAENESEAQQKSIEQQISSLEDYREYIEQYYEDLLNNPRNFIDQVNSILKMSQEDILTWLEQNSTDYKNSTDNTRTDMVNGWTETLNTMNGIINTHWKEVQDIISQGDEAVIAFLKENSSKYREASKLQQDAYIEGWQDMFDKIRKAYEDMQTNLLDNSSFINNSKWGGSDDDGSDSGSSGGSGSSKGTSSKKNTTASKTKCLICNRTDHTTLQHKDWLKEQAKSGMLGGTSSGGGGGSKFTTVMKYASGGIADKTGLAWLDGTTTNPERVLSPVQTKLFDSLVASLEQMTRVNVGGMRYSGNALTNSAKAYGYNFGDINIKVDHLDNDRDIEDLADKVKDAIVESMTRGRAVGGITL